MNKEQKKIFLETLHSMDERLRTEFIQLMIEKSDVPRTILLEILSSVIARMLTISKSKDVAVLPVDEIQFNNDKLKFITNNIESQTEEEILTTLSVTFASLIEMFKKVEG